MKFSISQILALSGDRPARHNQRVVFVFVFLLLSIIALYSVLFHFLMEAEGQQYSWVTGFYWTLTVMSTLGFGDITFESDLGRLFSIIVLLTGVVFLLILLPFTIIQFFYAPWIEAQAAARTPRALPSGTSGHVIIVHHNPVSEALMKRLERRGYDYVVIVSDYDEASRLHDSGRRVMFGRFDDPETYRAARVDQAMTVVATANDVTNTNVTFMVRQAASDIRVISTADSLTATDVLLRAGASGVPRLGDMIGRSLARCTVGGDAVSHPIGQIDGLVIAEANAQRTPLVGKSLRDCRLRELGVNVIGLLERGKFVAAAPDSVVQENAILLLAGTREQLLAYDSEFVIYNMNVAPVLVVGGGRVGNAAAAALAARGVSTRIVDRRRLPNQETGEGDAENEVRSEGIHGDARDPDVLRRAGLFETPAVLITTNDDNLNTYLTIYIRSVRPDIQIISRATLPESTQNLHRAGADFVHSYSSMGATDIFNRIRGDRVITVTEGLDVVPVKIPESLDGKTILESDVREKTGATIVALRRADGTVSVSPPADEVLHAGGEMIVAGSIGDQFRSFFG